MSGVVLRCPNCGTTRATPGECDACHEAAVRWFCRNHAGGRWIDGPPCPECGAGVERPAAPAPPPPRRHSTSPPSLDAPPRAPRPRRPVEEAWGELPWDAAEPADAGRGGAGGAGGAPGGFPGGLPGEWRVEAPPVRGRPIPILGCVGRLVMYAVTAVILLAMATCWFFGGGVMVGVAPDERPRVAAEWAAAAAAVAPPPAASPPP